MRSLRRNSYVSALLAGLVLFGTLPAHAFEARELNWDRLGEELSDSRRAISGNWADENSWNSTLCRGRYKYAASLNAVLTKVNFELKEDGSLDAKARIVDIDTQGDGSFRSWTTACITSRGGFHVLSPWAETDVRIHFDESDEGFTKIRLRILRTEFGKLEISRWLPNWVERLVTRAMNKSLSWLWASSLGAWLSEKIGGKVVELIPNPAP